MSHSLPATFGTVPSGTGHLRSLLLVCVVLGVAMLALPRLYAGVLAMLEAIWGSIELWPADPYLQTRRAYSTKLFLATRQVFSAPYAVCAGAVAIMVLFVAQDHLVQRKARKLNLGVLAAVCLMFVVLGLVPFMLLIGPVMQAR